MSVTKQNLYEISSNLYQLFEFLEAAETEEEREAVEEGLEIAEADLNEKAINYSKFIRSEEASCEAIDNEIKRLKKLKESKQRRIKLLTERLKEALLRIGKEKLDLGIFALSLRKSQALEITDEQLIPKQFIKTKIVPQIDKKAITDSIKAIQRRNQEKLKEDPNAELESELFPGAYIKTNKTLKIK